MTQVTVRVRISCGSVRACNYKLKFNWIPISATESRAEGYSPGHGVDRTSNAPTSCLLPSWPPQTTVSFHRPTYNRGVSMTLFEPWDFYFAGPDVEGQYRYRPEGYHPVHLGDIYSQRYRVIHKLGFDTYSTVWLARDLQSTTQT